MNKFVSAFLSRHNFVNHVDIYSTAQAIRDDMIKGLKNEKKVALTGFFTVENVHKDASVSKNPRTGEPVNVPARNVPKFKAGSKLKDALN